MKSCLQRREIKTHLHVMSSLERCIYCEYCWGFRRKIPMCRAERCIYEETDAKGDTSGG